MKQTKLEESRITYPHFFSHVKPHDTNPFSKWLQPCMPSIHHLSFSVAEPPRKKKEGT